MKVGIVLILCLICFAANVQAKSSFIVNGEDSIIRPFYAYIEMFMQPGLQGDPLFGGGSLVSQRAVLTVAQNIGLFQSWRVGLGANRLADMTTFNVESVHVHPLYNDADLANNIAVIRLTVEVPLSPTMLPIGRTPEGSTFPTAGSFGLAIGFGFGAVNVQPEVLQQAGLTVLSQEDCGLRYPHLIANNQLAYHFCAQNPAAGSNICAGDQGGPIFNPDTNMLFGVQSFNRVANCASIDSQPAAFLRVSHYQAFINQHL